MAFLLFSLLPDKWDGMSGSYMGKDWSSLQVLFDIYEVDYKREVLFFMKSYEVFVVKDINKENERKRKREEAKHRAPSRKP